MKTKMRRVSMDELKRLVQEQYESTRTSKRKALKFVLREIAETPKEKPLVEVLSKMIERVENPPVFPTVPRHVPEKKTWAEIVRDPETRKKAIATRRKNAEERRDLWERVKKGTIPNGRFYWFRAGGKLEDEVLKWVGLILEPRREMKTTAFAGMRGDVTQPWRLVEVHPDDIEAVATLMAECYWYYNGRTPEQIDGFAPVPLAEIYRALYRTRDIAPEDEPKEEATSLRSPKRKVVKLKRRMTTKELLMYGARMICNPTVSVLAMRRWAFKHGVKLERKVQNKRAILNRVADKKLKYKEVRVPMDPESPTQIARHLADLARQEGWK